MDQNLNDAEPSQEAQRSIALILENSERRSDTGGRSATHQAKAPHRDRHISCMPRQLELDLRLMDVGKTALPKNVDRPRPTVLPGPEAVAGLESPATVESSDQGGVDGKTHVSARLPDFSTHWVLHMEPMEPCLSETSTSPTSPTFWGRVKQLMKRGVGHITGKQEPDSEVPVDCDEQSVEL